MKKAHKYSPWVRFEMVHNSFTATMIAQVLKRSKQRLHGEGLSTLVQVGRQVRGIHNVQPPARK